MQQIKKDNLTDLVDQITKPQEASSAQPSNPQPQPKPQGGLNDYQVTTPDGTVIDLALNIASKDSKEQQIFNGVDKNGNQYILVVQRKTS